MSGLRALLSGLLLLTSTSLAAAQSQISSAPPPGSTVSLLFLNTTSVPLTGFVQRYEPSGQSTYLINCGKAAGGDCQIHDATLSVVEGQTYDFHTSVNEGGALTIHCTFEADGKTPAMCTRTVAGGPNGFEVTTSQPTSAEWMYLPVLITKTPQRTHFDGYAASSASFGASQTMTSATGVASERASASASGSFGASASAEATGTASPGDGSNAAEKITGRYSVTAAAAVALVVTQLFFLSA